MEKLSSSWWNWQESGWHFFLPSIITKTDPVLIDEETCGKVIGILIRGMILRIHLKHHYSSKIDNNQRNLLRPTGSVNTIPVIQQNPWKITTTKTKATMKALRTSVRRTTVSSQRTTETTRTTSSSQCITSAPMTTLTSTIAWCTSYVESSHRGYCSTLYDEIAPLMTQVLSNHIVISMSSMTASLWLDLSLLLLLILPVFLRLLPHSELFDKPTVIKSLRYSVADESEDIVNSFSSHTNLAPLLRAQNTYVYVSFHLIRSQHWDTRINLWTKV